VKAVAKRDSLKHQVIEKINSLKRFGQSKHAAKIAEKERCIKAGVKWNPARVEGIYSIKTCDTYKEHAIDFVKWLRRNRPEVKQLQHIKPGMVAKYLRERVDRGDSAWTVRVKAAAIAKVLGCSSKDFEGKTFQFPERKREKITRSREARTHDKHFSQTKHIPEIRFAVATGLRRHELASVRPDDVYKDDHGRVFVHVERGKGGRSREVPVLRSLEQHVWQMKTEAEREGREVIFEHIPNRMDVHSYRRDYASMLYDQFSQELPSSDPHDRSVWYHRRDGEVFDKAIAFKVSEALGHSRVDVVVRHYLD
jgi:integrase